MKRILLLDCISKFEIAMYTISIWRNNLEYFILMRMERLFHTYIDICRKYKFVIFYLVSSKVGRNDDVSMMDIYSKYL